MYYTCQRKKAYVQGLSMEKIFQSKNFLVFGLLLICVLFLITYKSVPFQQNEVYVQPTEVDEVLKSQDILYYKVTEELALKDKILESTNCGLETAEQQLLKLENDLSVVKIELESVKEDKMYVDSNKAQLEQIMVESLDNLNDELAMMKTMLEEIKSSSQDSTIMNHLNAKV